MLSYALGKYYGFDEVSAAIREIEASGGPPLDAADASLLTGGTDIGGMDLATQLRAGAAIAGSYVSMGLLRRDQLLTSTALQPATANANENKFLAYWWGYELYLDTPTINAIIGVLSIGGSIEGLMAVLAGALGGPGGIAVGILAAAAGALMGIGAGVLVLLNAQGRGLVVRGIWFPPLSYIWSQ